MKASKITNQVLSEMKRFSTPDEVREFPNGRLEVVTIGVLR